MDNELKTLLEETLKVHKKITFYFNYVSKGCEVELLIGEKHNKEHGLIYDKLYHWIGYDVFVDYMLSKDVYCNFMGFIELTDGDIIFTVELYGTEHEKIDLNEELISKTLGIDLTSLGLDNEFEEGCFSVNFTKSNNHPFEQLEFSYYFDEWKEIELNEDQTIKLSNFLENVIEDSLPLLSFDFDCEVEFEFTCQENYLECYYNSTPIEIKLSSII
jgi:hypothetical protein